MTRVRTCIAAVGGLGLLAIGLLAPEVFVTSSTGSWFAVTGT
jgi:hypothetical protein